MNGRGWATRAGWHHGSARVRVRVGTSQPLSNPYPQRGLRVTRLAGGGFTCLKWQVRDPSFWIFFSLSLSLSISHCRSQHTRRMKTDQTHTPKKLKTNAKRDLHTHNAEARLHENFVLQFITTAVVELDKNVIMLPGFMPC